LRSYARDVANERVGPAGHVGHNGVVDDELGGNRRVDAGDDVPHGGQVDQGRHTVGVVQEDPGRMQVDGVRERVGRAPVEQRLDLVGGDAPAVLVAQQVLQHDAEAVRQVGWRDRGKAVHGEKVIADGQRSGGPEAIGSH
jgi:hypothetical protein